MEVMQTQNLRMMPRVHVLVRHVPKYERITGVPLGPTSEQALGSQHTPFDIFFHRFKANCTKSPIFA